MKQTNIDFQHWVGMVGYQLSAWYRFSKGLVCLKCSSLGWSVYRKDALHLFLCPVFLHRSAGAAEKANSGKSADPLQEHHHRLATRHGQLQPCQELHHSVQDEGQSVDQVSWDYPPLCRGLHRHWVSVFPLSVCWGFPSVWLAPVGVICRVFVSCCG